MTRRARDPGLFVFENGPRFFLRLLVYLVIHDVIKKKKKNALDALRDVLLVDIPTLFGWEGMVGVLSV